MTAAVILQSAFCLTLNITHTSVWKKAKEVCVCVWTANISLLLGNFPTLNNATGSNRTTVSLNDRTEILLLFISPVSMMVVLHKLHLFAVMAVHILSISYTKHFNDHITRVITRVA